MMSQARIFSVLQNSFMCSYSPFLCHDPSTAPQTTLTSLAGDRRLCCTIFLGGDIVIYDAASLDIARVAIFSDGFLLTLLSHNSMKAPHTKLTSLVGDRMSGCTLLLGEGILGG